MFRHSLMDQLPSPYGNYRFVDDWYFFLRAAHHTLFWGIPEILVKMNRGKNHLHLSRAFAGTKEAQQVSREVYRLFKNDPQSPINRKLYRKSVSTLLTSKGRYLGGWKGFSYLLRAVLWDPHNKRARKSLREFSTGAFEKSDDFSKWLQA